MNYIQELHKKNLRPDFRDQNDSINYEINLKDNKIFLKTRNTLIYITTQKLTTQPHPDKPHQGILKISVPMDKKLNKILKKIFKEVIDLESLSIKYNELCYLILLEVRIIESDNFMLKGIVEVINKTFEYLEITCNYKPECNYYIKNNGIVLKDPLYIEEENKEWSIITVKDGRDILYIEKTGCECQFDEILNIIQK